MAHQGGDGGPTDSPGGYAHDPLASASQGDRMQLLNDLACERLAQGKVEEAQQLFTQLAALRLPDVSIQRTASALDPAGHGETTQGSGAQGRLSHASQEDSDDDWETKSFTSPMAQLPPPVTTATPQAKELTEPASRTWPMPDRHDSEWEPSARSGNERSTPGSAAPKKSRADANRVATDEDAQPSFVTWEGGFDHCVEVHGLTAEIKTSDLQAFLDEVLPDVKLQPCIRWADTQHAVYVCSCATDAQRLLDEGGPYALRPFSEASQASKQLPISELLPPKARPKTSTAVAKKLLSHALGLPGLRDKQGEQKLAAARREAKQERAARQEAAASVWGDDGS